MRRRVAVVLLASLALGQPAAAQATADDIWIQDVRLAVDGASRLLFRAPAGLGALTTADMELSENGESIEQFVLEPIITQADGLTARLAMAIDVSGSTAGDALGAARTAAASLAATLTSRGVEVALIAFADQARLLVGPTTDVAALTAAIDGLVAGGDTALNDAVLLAARTLLEGDADSRVLLFTDGRDDGSVASLATAVEAITLARLPVSSVLLQTSDTDVAALEALAATAGGTVASVGEVEGLAAAFDQVANEIPTAYAVTWQSMRLDTELVVRLTIGGASDESLALNPRRPVPTLPQAVAPASSGLFRTQRGLALALFGIGLAAFLVMLLSPRRDRAASRALAIASAPSPRVPERTGQDPSRSAAATLRSRMTSRAADALEAVPRRPQHDADVAMLLERAGWTLRPAELQVLRLASAATGFVLVAGITQRLVVGVIAAAISLLIPGLLASRAHAKRQEAFVSQMPDVLQLISGSLKAGYGLVQAIDLVVQESTPPLSSEFRRVINEHLLGLELEEALEAMAHRIDSEDLRWVVVAMNIQRRVGGNLAELLEIVAQTLRERATVRRHVQSLSAEGRLSARILTAMPFIIGGYVAVVNPDYIGELFTDPRGQAMLVGAVVAMLLGSLWMRKLVDIEV